MVALYRVRRINTLDVTCALNQKPVVEKGIGFGRIVSINTLNNNINEVIGIFLYSFLGVGYRVPKCLFSFK